MAPRSPHPGDFSPPHQGFLGLVSPSSSGPACRTPPWILTWVPSACSPPCLSMVCTSPLMEPSLGDRLCHPFCTQCPPPAWVSLLGPQGSTHPPPMSQLDGLTRAPSCHAPGCPDFSPHLAPLPPSHHERRLLTGTPLRPCPCPLTAEPASVLKPKGAQRSCMVLMGPILLQEPLPGLVGPSGCLTALSATTLTPKPVPTEPPEGPAKAQVGHTPFLIRCSHIPTPQTPLPGASRAARGLTPCRLRAHRLLPTSSWLPLLQARPTLPQGLGTCLSLCQQCSSRGVGRPTVLTDSWWHLDFKMCNPNTGNPSPAFHFPFLAFSPLFLAQILERFESCFCRL